MTPEEIRDIARKYVADVYGGDTDFIDEAENVITWLLRDHCVVSKSEIRDYRKSVNNNHANALDRFDCGYNLGCEDTLDYLFISEIGKEGEG